MASGVQTARRARLSQREGRLAVWHCSYCSYARLNCTSLRFRLQMKEKCWVEWLGSPLFKSRHLLHTADAESSRSRGALKVGAPGLRASGSLEKNFGFLRHCWSLLWRRGVQVYFETERYRRPELALEHLCGGVLWQFDEKETRTCRGQAVVHALAGQSSRRSKRSVGHFQRLVVSEEKRNAMHKRVSLRGAAERPQCLVWP